LAKPGEHTDEVLSAIGFSRTDIEALRSKHIVA
jgi:crotonobetainyl-CoA:carnitine CoA-transferase CaiB-like acyl-CoA transferase